MCFLRAVVNRLQLVSAAGARVVPCVRGAGADDELLGSSAGRLSGVTSGDESSRGISPRPSVARHMVVANGTNGGNGAAAGGNGDGLELPAGMVVGPDGMLITLAPDPAIQVAAAAAVTAENELSSKVLGSQVRCLGGAAAAEGVGGVTQRERAGDRRVATSSCSRCGGCAQDPIDHTTNT